jgi:glycosyltransferase involved in cell wall biosynthesis
MTRRSVVQVTLWNSPYLGNFMSAQLVLAAAVLARFGLNTHFVLADGAQGQPWLAELDVPGLTWSILPPGRSGWRAHLKRVVQDHGAAMVHTHFTGGDLPAASVAARARVPCVWQAHTGFEGYSPERRVKDLLKWRLVGRRRVARLIVVSPWLGELALRRGVPAERIEVVPNAIIIERFAQLPDRAAARRRFGLEDDAIVVLGLGWWPEVKGVDLLIAALDRLAGQRPDMQALLVGNERMDSFLAQHLSVRPPWLRTSPFVDDAAWLFAAADIFVSASRHEGQSAAIGEAIACGLPVVMSDIDGTSGWVPAPGVSTFTSGDPGALATSLGAVLGETPDARAAVGAENRRWASVHLGPDRWCEQVCEIYRSLLEPGEAPSGEPMLGSQQQA